MNTRAKGKRNERKARKQLEEEGFQVVAPNYSRYGYTDFFNLWDLIAVNDKQVRFVQVKSNKNDCYGKKLMKYADFPCPPNCTKEVWLIENRKEPVIYFLP